MNKIIIIIFALMLFSCINNSGSVHHSYKYRIEYVIGMREDWDFTNEVFKTAEGCIEYYDVRGQKITKCGSYTIVELN